MNSGHRHTAPGQHEHEFDAAHGLPEPLPPGERILWQGAPHWPTLARRAFHLRKLAAYFGVIVVLRAAFVLSDGGTEVAALTAALWLAPLPLLGLGIVALLARLASRTTVYTITDKRIVMRVGIVLTVAFNLPLARIASAALRLEANGTGDIPLALASNDRIAWLHLWPHARPWCITHPEPMLRSVPHASEVARILAAAWSQATQEPLPLERPTARPQPSAGKAGSGARAAAGRRSAPAMATH